MKNIVDITTESSVTNCRKRKRITNTNSIKQENKRRRDSKTDDFLIKKMKKIKRNFMEACNSDDVDIGRTKYCKGAPSRRQLESEISVPEFSGRKNLTPPSKPCRSTKSFHKTSSVVVTITMDF